MTDPELDVPILSRGKHRSPRKGACFMEFASYLAGERWSDHPACTHPLLATLARDVNDCTSDRSRQRLAVLIPSVIGLTSDDVRVQPRITLRCIWAALPVVSEDRQHVLAVGLLSAERMLARTEGRAENDLTPQSRAALAAAPGAARWAATFVARTTPRDFRRRTAERLVRCAVEGLAQACVTNPDERLRDLLAAAIAECETWVARPVPAGELAVTPGR